MHPAEQDDQILRRDFGPLPVVIGVTGHRDLRPGDRDSTYAAIKVFLLELRAQLKHTPLVFLSALAEGADQLVAEVVFDLEGVVIVPLPMPETEYLATFDSQAGRDAYHSLIRRQNCYYFVIPQSEPPAEWQGSAENFRFAQLAQFLGAHSHILIALWDGAESDKPGGTFQVIERQLGRERPAGIAGATSAGPVYRIAVHRQSRPGPARGPVGYLDPLGPDANAIPRPLWWKNFEELDQCNRQCLAAGDAGLLETRRDLLDDADYDRLLAPQKYYARIFAEADRFAKQKGRYFWRCAAFLYVFFGLALVLAAVGQTELIVDKAMKFELWSAVILCLAVVSGVTLWAHQRRIGIHYLHYRALAEGMRVLFYWNLAGIGKSIDAHFLRQERFENHWVRWSLRGIEAFRWAGLDAAAQRAHNLDVVESKWVIQQASWLAQKSSDQAKIAGQVAAAHQFVVYAGLGLSLVLLLVIMAEYFINPQLAEDFFESVYRRLTTGLLLAATGAFGAWRGYLEVKAYGAQAREYRLLARWFERARKFCAQHRGDEEAIRRELVELGQLALEENGNWVALHKEKQLEAQSAG